MSKIILKAEDLDGYLTDADRDHLERMDALFRQAMVCFNYLSTTSEGAGRQREEQTLTGLYSTMGGFMQEICRDEPRIQVHSFVTSPENHGEASRLIAKLRNVNTGRQEFVYYIQRAFEMLFRLAFVNAGSLAKNNFIVRTPVTVPVQNYAVHKIPNIDPLIENTVMCVMLRGALLPSMIVSKEIQEFSSTGYVTAFALFKIKRDDTRTESTMEYILDLDRSYFRIEDLHDRDLLFADPMNATGGSLVTVINYLKSQGVVPRSVRFFNVVSALKGALRVVRAIENATVYTLWMDPILNDKAYIMPGLGDAGDRINGKDEDERPRDMLQLVADYGTNITGLYRSQLRIIEETVLAR